MAVAERGEMKAETYQLLNSKGKPIRKASSVACNGGRVIRFMELLSKKEAIRQAKALLAREQETLKRVLVNPETEKMY